MLTQPLRIWGFWLFAASLGIACFGAALEISLDTAYIVAQSFGWNWGESLRPKQAARFSAVYTVFVFLAALLMVVGYRSTTTDAVLNGAHRSCSSISRFALSDFDER